MITPDEGCRDGMLLRVAFDGGRGRRRPGGWGMPADRTDRGKWRLVAVLCGSTDIARDTSLYLEISDHSVTDWAIWGAGSDRPLPASRRTCCAQAWACPTLPARPPARNAMRFGRMLVRTRDHRGRPEPFEGYPLYANRRSGPIVMA